MTGAAATADHERRQVYTAETASLTGTPFDDSPGRAAVDDAFERVFTSRWWASLAGGSRPSVTFTGRHPNGVFRPGRNIIHLGTEATWLTMAHELAHVVDHHLELQGGVSGSARPRGEAPLAADVRRTHDAVFRGCEVAVFTAVFGSDVADLLDAGFRRFALAVTPVAWPAPAVPVALWFEATWRIERGGWRADRRSRVQPRAAQRATTL